MAISGIGSQSTALYSPRSLGNRDKATRDGVQDSLATNTAAPKPDETKPERFAPVPVSPDTNKATTSRQNLSEIEANRSRYQQLSSSQRLQDEPGKAVQSFLDVADFERKDELTGMVGIDIYI